jgi:hypothetical protein
VAVLPVPFERTTSYGKGTALGPAAILEASRQVELWEEMLRSEPWRMGIATLPPFVAKAYDAEAAIVELEAEARRHLAAGKFLVTLGGEHSLTTAPARAAHSVHGKGGPSDIGIVQFDAHADLRPEYDGTPWSHASVMRRLHEEDFPALAVGIRALCDEEAALIADKGLPTIWGWELPARERNALWMANPGARRITRLYQTDFAARVSGIDATRELGMIPNDWGSPRLIDGVLRADLARYLPDDLLFKADITSMAFGLELRSPFLDHRVVEFAAALPAAWKVRGSGGKWFLREAYRGHIPESVRRGRKAGFGLPIDHWFRDGLRGPAHDLLLGPGAQSREYLKRDAVAAVLKIHRSGQRNYDEMIWTLLVLELWLRSRRGRSRREAA